MNNLSPDNIKSGRPNLDSQSMKADNNGNNLRNSPTYDEYEDLLNTIEQENNKVTLEPASQATANQRRESH